MDVEINPRPLAVPGDWQGPETVDHWWCTGCGMWAGCDDQDRCQRCTDGEAGKPNPAEREGLEPSIRVTPDSAFSERV
jgi:hypothetical protein